MSGSFTFKIQRATGKISNENLRKYIKRIFDMFDTYDNELEHENDDGESFLQDISIEQDPDKEMESSLQLNATIPYSVENEKKIYDKIAVLFRKLNKKYAEKELVLNITFIEPDEDPKFMADDDFTKIEIHQNNVALSQWHNYLDNIIDDDVPEFTQVGGKRKRKRKNKTSTNGRRSKKHRTTTRRRRSNNHNAR